MTKRPKKQKTENQKPKTKTPKNQRTKYQKPKNKKHK